MPSGLHDLLSYFSTSGTYQVDFMFFELLLYFWNMPAGLNDLWPTASEKPSVSRRFSMFFLEDVIGGTVMTGLGGVMINLPCRKC
jgi:hypothetical protein